MVEFCKQVKSERRQSRRGFLAEAGTFSAGWAVDRCAATIAAPAVWLSGRGAIAAPIAGDPVQNTRNLQLKIDELAVQGGGTLRLEEGVFRIDRPLVVPAKVSIIGPGQNRCLIQNIYPNATSAWQQAPVITTGNFATTYTTQMWGHANSRPLAAVTRGDDAATLTHASHASAFAVNDLVVFCSNACYVDATGSNIAHYMALRKITKISGALLYVDEPFFDAFTGFAYNMRSNTINGAANTVGGAPVPLFVWGDAEIGGFSVSTGGTWINGASAVYKGRFSDIDVQRSRRIWYGNTLQHSTFDGVNGRFMDKAGELSLNSENTIVQNWTASFDGAASDKAGIAPTSGITMQENGINVTYRNGSLDITGFVTRASPVLGVNNFERGTFENIDIVHRGPAFRGNVIEIGNNTSVLGRREARDARINVRWSGTCARYLSMTNPHTTGCIVDGDFRGPVMTGEAFRFAGTVLPNTIAQSARFEQGKGKLARGVKNQVISGCFIGGGMARNSSDDRDGLSLNRISGIRTFK